MDSLKILIAQQSLCVSGETEKFTVELSRELQSLGHQVAVYTSEKGGLEKDLSASGIPVVETLREIPWKPDVIHGHHHLQTLAALNFFPQTPVAYCCHNDTPWTQSPPKHPNIFRYIFMSKRMYQNFQTRCSWLQEGDCIHLWRSFQPKLFPRTRTPFSQKGRALYYADFKLNSIDQTTLGQACSDLGVSLDFFDKFPTEDQSYPNKILLDYEIIFASGQRAVEASASGCAVIPLSQSRVGEALSFSNLTRYMDCDFTAATFNYDLAIDAENLKLQMEKAQKVDLSEITPWVRSHLTLPLLIEKLVENYLEIIKRAQYKMPQLLPLVPQQTALYWENYLQDFARPLSELAKARAELQALTQRFNDLQRSLSFPIPSETFATSESDEPSTNSELSELLEKYQQLEAAKTKCESESHTLKARIARLENERQAFRESLQQKRTRLEETKDQLRNLQKDFKNLQVLHQRLLQFLRRSFLGNRLVKKFKNRNPNLL